MRAIPHHIVIAVICCAVLCPGTAWARDEQRVDPAGSDAIETVMKDAADALARGDARMVSRYFPLKVYLNIFTGENAYYSREQGAMILRNFLASYQPVSFTYTGINRGGRNPYGVGTLSFMHQGRRGTAQVYLSLTSTQDGWKIGHITISRR
jgi:hypothetical protein